VSRSASAALYAAQIVLDLETPTIGRIAIGQACVAVYKGNPLCSANPAPFGNTGDTRCSDRASLGGGLWGQPHNIKDSAQLGTPGTGVNVAVCEDNRTQQHRFCSA
jgi:hypothetical protein